MSSTLPSALEAPVLRPGVFEGVSDDRLEAELRDAGLLVSGSGGNDIHGPDFTGGGGDGDGWDDEEWPRRHHSRAVRVTALAFASLLVLGTAGAWVSLVIAVDHPAFPASVTVMGEHSTPAASSAAGRTTPQRTTITLSLAVANRSGSAATPSCAVLVDDGGHEAGKAVRLHPLADGATEGRTVTITVPGAPAALVPETATFCAPR